MTIEMQRHNRGRREDLRLITGAGRYTSDIDVPGTAIAKFVRARHPHARIDTIDTAQARALPGVIGVFTAQDLAADGLCDLPQGVDLRGPDDRAPLRAARPILASSVVRHLGEPVALVVAESAAAAADAVDAVIVDYTPLPAVSTAAQARAAGAPPVWADAPDNVGFVWRGGGWDAIEQRLRNSAHVARHTFRISRVVAHPMEMRAALGLIDEDNRFVIYISHQQPHFLRDILARDIFRVDPARVRVIAPDIGGSFGLKTSVHSEDVLVLWAAQRLRRPVRWVCDRSEAFLADDHSRDIDATVSLGLDDQGNFTAFKLHFDVNVGAYISGRSTAPIHNVGGAAGVYRTPVIAAEIFGVMTNTVPTGPYRGAGRPEATFAIERIIDIAARERGIDPFELRRRNLIAPNAMPYKTPLTFTYDCGDFAGNMDRAAQIAELATFPARRAQAAKNGRLRGIGICNLIEAAGGPFGRPVGDSSVLRVNPDGSILLTSGSVSTGQGFATTIAELVAERLGVPSDRIEIRQGDTDDLARGRGNGGSSALCVSGTSVNLAVDRVIEKAHRLAAEHLEAAEADIRFAAGRFTVLGTDHGCSLSELAAFAQARPDGEGLVAEAQFQPPGVTFPNGCHICEVEIDPQTGKTEVIRYAAVEDVGRVLSPVLVEGQLQGGIAQGIGQAMSECVLYDDASGQLVTGSFLDYGMPRADDLPNFVTQTQEVLTGVNPLGAKGVGEAGTVGSLVVTINAICDALAPLGIRHFDMPATPERIWSAIDAAGSGKTQP